MKLGTYDLNYPKAIRHYAEGMAYLGKGDVDKAKAEFSALEILSKDDSLKAVTIWDINDVHVLVQIAKKVLKAEILAHEKDYDASIVLLREAIAIEDALNYNEPPDWFFSIRHHLGPVLIMNGQNRVAIELYKEDLKTFPNNGWAHHGLKQAYSALNDSENVLRMNNLISESWAHADYSIR